jgi:hypothetical protein
MSELTEADRRQLASHGLPIEEAERQLELLAGSQPYLDLDRPCQLGDGISALAAQDHAELIARAERAAAAGRLIKFVPASGAASRMFQPLWSFARSPEAAAGRLTPEASEFFTRIDQFAFHRRLEQELDRGGLRLAKLIREGEFAGVIDALLGCGLDYGAAPKALIEFHRYGRGARTALEEQLVESTHYVLDRQGRCRVHLTVAPGDRARIERHLRERVGPLERRYGVRLEVTISDQPPATDTLAVDGDGRPFRRPDGTLLLRPGGHGALLGNLAALTADLAFLRNIDNVQPERAHRLVAHWKKLLLGRLLQLEEESHALQRALSARTVTSAVWTRVDQFLRRSLGTMPRPWPEATPERRRLLALDRLDRPLRVCGVVAHRGEAGGGPFWVRGADGVLTLQIVEAAQVDPGDPDQQRIWRAATHFNPVDVVCTLRDAGGRPYALERYRDSSAVLFVRKTHDGRPLRGLEHPGLWNGAMAGWNTFFVEVPAETFAPVKTVLDLLRPEHQP